MSVEINPPFRVFTDVDGEPLEDGFIHIGAVNQNPQAVPISVFWDSALTIPAAQPIRTLGGYPSRSGTPSRMYVAETEYSISVSNKNSTLIYSDLNNQVGNAALQQRLADAVNPANGAAMIGYRGQTLAFYQGLIVSPYQYGAVGDGVTDDTVAVQDALDALAVMGGGTLAAYGNFLVGGLEVNTQYVLIKGRSERDKFTVKNGTIGVHVKQHWVSFENFRVVSQGTKGDGLGTNGILYDKGGVTSTGFVYNNRLTVSGFSGYGMRCVNAISFSMQTCYVLSCTTGVDFQRDSGGVLFSTTVFFDNVYVTSCTTGINGQYVYRSRFNVIGEFCDYAMDMFAGDFTLERCYFESNNIRGARTRNSFVQDNYTYNNNVVTDAVSIEFEVGVIPAADRGHAKSKDFDITAKRLALLSGFGVDPRFFSGVGDSVNVGAYYDTSTVVLSRGPNIASHSAWASRRLAEFTGWNVTNRGFKVSGVTAGDLSYGIKQTVTLDNTKQYIIDIAWTTVLGTGITTIRCGGVGVTNGVPFTPTANGANVIEAFGTDTLGTTFEIYITAFSISESVKSLQQTAINQDRGNKQRQGRDVIYMSAAPTTGTWAVGEVVYHSAPTAGGFIGWVCTTAGTPGTWKTWGAITA